MKFASLSKSVLLLVALLMGGLAVAQGNFQQSDSQARNSNEPNQRARIHTELGSLYFQAGSMAVALEELGIALNADSSYFPAYNTRALVYASLKEFAKADEDFRRALDLAPNDPEVNNNYGWYLCEYGRERQSISYFLNALKSPLYETPERAYTNAGACALKAGDYDGAQAYLLKALQLSRDGAVMARFQLASLLYRRGNYDEARIYLNDSLRLMEPPTAEALWLGLRLERKLGNRNAESTYASQLRGRYPASQQYQEFLKGNFE